METLSWRKVLQKQIYDIISHRYGLLVILIGAILIVVSAFHFGESMVEWSTEKYAAVFNSFSDNLAGKSFRERLSLPVPIDVVYTWVNGTDQQLIMNLQRLKLEMKDQLNTSSEVQCVFRNCLPSNIVVIDPVLPENMTLAQLGVMIPLLSNVKDMFKVTSPIDYSNYTAMVFTEEEHVLALLNTTVTIKGRNTTIVRCHITSDSTIQNGIKLTNQIIMSGFPHTLTSEELKMKLPDKLQKGIDKIDVHSDKGIAVLHVPVREDFDKLLAESNFTIEGKEPTLNAAHLVWDLRDFSRDEDISASRFEDNEELRYSLRSLERFAPWVRHVYIVTNGQLPYWLNLENHRITIVTHDEIFQNKSHLPSFGSPAIESNLHRIPGLSDKFIYMNDDVMFGKEVWPDDFYTHSTGHKIYLTWPVPNCNEGCPSSWIKDGYCDKACNVSECEWDAGDCTGVKENQQNALGGWAGVGQTDTKSYCHTGCANNWIADRYCDTACNVIDCGYDAGDCGTDKYGDLHSFMLLSNQTYYKLPPGVTQVYFNLTSLLTTTANVSSVKSALYDDNNVIRTIAVARKYNVMTVLLHQGYNTTNINFTLGYGHDNYTAQINFTLTSYTAYIPPVPVVNVTKVNMTLEGKNISIATNTSQVKVVEQEEEVVVFEDLPENMLNPVKLDAKPELPAMIGVIPANWSTIPLPPHLAKVYRGLQTELQDGELLESGYQHRLQTLWLSYQDYLKHNNSKSIESQHLKLPKNIIKGPKHKSGASKVLQDENRPIGFEKSKNKLEVDAPKSHDQQPQKEAGVKFEKSHDQEKEEPVRAAGRKLMNINEIEMEVEHTDFIDSVDIQPETGKLLPWEHGSLAVLQEEREKQAIQEQFQVSGHPGARRLLDTFGDSLRHVNTLYNKAFGYTARKVPGHMPHMIDKHIMGELQARFPAEWDATSSHQVRSSTDMQYAFSYMYYVMGVKENTTAASVFDMMDTDRSKILSDREIRTLATRLYELPLDLPTLSKLEYIFVNCSKNLTMSIQQQPDAASAETYYEAYMPQVTRNLFINCPEMIVLVRSNFPPRNKYKHTTSDDSEIAFKMIKSNISTVVGQLDDIRKHPKKFICLNDNIDHRLEQARTVKAILQDFYESVFPIESQFELPRDYRNRFTHIDELREWRRYRDWLKFWTHIALAFLVLFTIASYFADKIEAAQKRYRRRRQTTDTSSSTVTTTTVARGGTIETV